VKEKENHILSFFFFFHLFSRSPLKKKKKISEFKSQPNTHPPTMNITPLCSPHDALQGGGGFIVIGEVDKND